MSLKILSVLLPLVLPPGPVADDQGDNANQPQCSSAEAMQSALKSQFGESMIGVGKAGQMAMSLFTAADGATWSLVVLSPEGKACLVAAGKNWHSKAIAKAEPKSQEDNYK